jgi:hypothetical protein
MKGQVMAIYQHIRHPGIAARRADRPVKVADLLRRDSAVNRFNTKVAIVITRVVGSMWVCLRVRAVRPDQSPGRNPRGGVDVRFLGGTDLPATGAVVDHHGRAERTG